MSDGPDAVVKHLKECVGVDGVIVMHDRRESADDIIEQLLAEGWTWDERGEERIAGKRIRYLRTPVRESSDE